MKQEIVTIYHGHHCWRFYCKCGARGEFALRQRVVHCWLCGRVHKKRPKKLGAVVTGAALKPGR